MNAFVDYALEYASRGWSVIPLAPKNKTCILNTWKPYQETIATEEEIRAWWKINPNANVAIVTGKVSGIFALDIDGEEGKAAISGRPMPVTPATRTGKGFHYIYKLPKDIEIRNSARKIGPGLDIRGEGGYIVAPPSIHSSGSTYEWLVQDYPAEAPEWLLKAILGGGEDESTPKSSGWVIQALKGVPAGQRDQTFVQLTGHWTRLGVPIEEQIELLKMQNERNVPPEPEKDFEALVKRIYANHKDKNKVTVVPQEWTSTASNILMQPPQPTRWLIEDLWTEESCGFIGGEPKTGKTWTGFEMAISIVSDSLVFGHFKVHKPGPVLYVAEEGNEEQIRSRLHKITAAKCVQAEYLDNFHLAIQKNVMVDIKEWQAALFDFCSRVQPRAVFLDPLVRIHSSGENQAEDMREVLQFLRSIQVNFHCSVIVIHHQRKPSKDDSSRTGQRLRGTGDLYAWLDSAIYLTKKLGEETVIGVEVEHRNAGEIQPFTLDQNIGEDEANIIYKESSLESVKALEMAKEFEKIILNMPENEILNKDLISKISANEQLKYKALGLLQTFKTVVKNPHVKRPDSSGKMRFQTVWLKVN